MAGTGLRQVARYALEMGADERRVFVLLEFEDGSRARMGPRDRDATIGLIAMYGARAAGVDVAMFADPESETIRLAYDGYREASSGASAA